MNNGYMYNPYMMQQPRYQQMEMPQQQMNQQQMQPPLPNYNNANKQNVLNGKLVESVDVVKVIDIPMDGSINYFPVADGSAIATKQLQPDGTSKTIIYRPITEEEKVAQTYVTTNDLEEMISRFDFPDVEYLKEDLKELRKELKDIKIKLKIKEN